MAFGGKGVRVVLLLSLASFFAYPSVAVSSEPLLPHFPAIEKNVRFWEKVYSEHTLSQGVIHDRRDLGIVYAVVNLKYPGNTNNRSANRKRVDLVKKRYRRMLLKLASGRAPSSFEERRVLRMFGPDPSLEVIARAADNMRLQRGQRGRFKRGVARSGAYLEEIKSIFREHELPEDLVYLAHVESSYNHNASSHAGAVGLWQFIRRTGSRFLKIDYAVDERLDPLKSSWAAAEFLQENYESLGSWPLAITAYNHGPGGVRRAVRAKGDFGRIIKEYRGRLFGFASRNFYAEFLAARHVAVNYRKYFGDIDFDKPEAIRHVTLEGFVDARKLAGFFNTGIETLKKFNPDLRQNILQGKRFIPAGYEVRLPARLVQQARLEEGIPENLYSAGRKNELFHKVRSGQSVAAIANEHGVPLEDLILANNLSDKYAFIYAGQNMRIPKPGSSPVHLTMPYKLLAKNLRRTVADT